jgi:hypothetical protein
MAQTAMWATSLALLFGCATHASAPGAGGPFETLFGFSPPRGAKIVEDCPGGEVAMRARFAGVQGIVCSDFPNDAAVDYAREVYTRNALLAGWTSTEPLLGFYPPAVSRFNAKRGCTEHLFFDRGKRESLGDSPAMTLNMMLVDDPACRTTKATP